MSANQRLDYYELGDALARAKTAVDSADCHGLLVGLVCTTGVAEPGLWLGQIFADFDPKDKLQAEAFRQLSLLNQDTQAQIDSADMAFSLLLPDDDDALRDRTEALGSWCGGFLTGLGLGGISDRAQLSEEATELLDDLGQIARVDFDLESPGEDDLAAFEEVTEYVRVGVLVIYEELRPVTQIH